MLVRNSLLNLVSERKIEGRIEVMGKRNRRRKQLMDGLKENRGYLKLQKETLALTLWRTRFGRDCGPT
jgi:hypothetical protein